MPSITYIEDDQKPDTTLPGTTSRAGDAPEPPVRYDSNAFPPEQPEGPQHDDHTSVFYDTRRLITIAQIMALVSLLIGGVFLSTAALVVATMAFRKSKALLEGQQQDQLSGQLLKRSATIALVMATLVLIANIVALVFVYPIVMEALQSGEYSSLFANSPQPPITGSTSSTWG